MILPVDEYRWEPASRGAIPAGAQPHGRDQDGEALWLCRAHFAGGLHPGKVRPEFGGANIAYGGTEQVVADYEVLMESGTWVPARAGEVPETAVPCGREAGGETLYAARATLDNGGLQLGKVRPAFGAANVGFANHEIITQVYEVLVAPGTVVPTPVVMPDGQDEQDDIPIYSNLREFAGLPVVRWNAPDPVDPAGVAWLVDTEEFEEPLSVYEASLEQVLSRTGAGGPVALVLGEWGSAYETPAPYDMLIRNAGRLGNLRALFVGDMTSEQCEISWIQQADITPLLAAFPALERLWIRGGVGLELTPVRHTGLTEVVIQSGGLPPAVVRAVGECDLPRLSHLELWLGVENYEGGATLEDLAPLLSGRVLPALTHLGLCNAENADEIAAAVAAAPVVARLAELDLSKGTLGDDGATALLAGQPLSHLHGLNLSHHFMSAEIAERLVEELPGVAVNVGHPCKEEEWGRYTLAAE
jgi:hypothetical protein